VASRTRAALSTSIPDSLLMSMLISELPTDGEEPPVGLLGDIVLCPEVADRQAREHQRTTSEEAEYLLVHGLLHLLGYDHANPEDHAEMFGLTDKIISAWAAQRPDRPEGAS
jgi:probable rRNA maturation factor